VGILLGMMVDVYILSLNSKQLTVGGFNHDDPFFIPKAKGFFIDVTIIHQNE